MNLAVADLFKVALDLPMSAASSFYAKWIFGKLG
jgi:hypothetical protein